MMKISVIITFHQYKNYLKECLCALKDSSFHDYETILVCDHEKENIDDLFEEYQKPCHMRRFALENKHGVAAARNYGLSLAQGEYILFLDSDDYVLEGTLAKLAEKMDGKNEIIYGSVHNTWNKKENYLEKRKMRLEDMDEEESLMMEEEKQQRIVEYLSLHQGKEKEEKLLGIYHLLKKKKGLNNITVLGAAYQNRFLQQHQLQFQEDFTYYSDLPFLLAVLEQGEIYGDALEAVYVKRKHNDPIHYPALVQMEDENRFPERMNVFTYARSVIAPDGLLRFHLDNTIINYYIRHFIRRLRRSEKVEWRNDYYPMFSKVMKEVRLDVVNNRSRSVKNMVQSLQNNDLNKTLRQVRWYLGKKKFSRMLKNKNVFYKLAYYHIFLKQPIIKNVVLFETFTGKNYSDSPKYIYEYLAKNYGDQFTFVWVLNTKTKPKYGGKKVKRFSFRYAYYLARAQYLVFNARQPLWYRKREGQVFLETWHGTPLKRLVFDQEEVTAASPKYKQQFYKQRQDWDYLISANDFSTETLRRCFLFEGEMLDYGYPRNDILYQENREELADEIKRNLHIPLDKKTILYAPTWRDDEYYGKGQYKFTLKLDLELLRKRLGDDYVILLRTHQYIADALDISGMEGFAYNVSKYDDISELYLISDICITDYSSVFFDFANLKRPMLFYTYDIDKYKNQLRGFYIDMERELPGPLLYTSEEVVDAIVHIDQVKEAFADKYDEFYQRFCHLDDGKASQRVVERVFLNQK